MIKFKIKNQFWKQSPFIQIEKLLKLNFFLGFFLMTNIIYSMFTQKWFLFWINIIPYLIIVLVQISYNKRNRE